MWAYHRVFTREKQVHLRDQDKKEYSNLGKLKKSSRAGYLSAK